MHDLLGLLLLIRINYAHQLIMNKRRVPCLDTYLDRINLMLWPRLKVGLHSPVCHSCDLSFSHVCHLHKLVAQETPLPLAPLTCETPLESPVLALLRPRSDCP